VVILRSYGDFKTDHISEFATNRIFKHRNLTRIKRQNKAFSVQNTYRNVVFNCQSLKCIGQRHVMSYKFIIGCVFWVSSRAITRLRSFSTL
jgi:hypothetical protein